MKTFFKIFFLLLISNFSLKSENFNEQINYNYKINKKENSEDLDKSQEISELANNKFNKLNFNKENIKNSVTNFIKNNRKKLIAAGIFLAYSVVSYKHLYNKLNRKNNSNAGFNKLQEVGFVRFYLAGLLKIPKELLSYFVSQDNYARTKLKEFINQTLLG